MYKIHRNPFQNKYILKNAQITQFACFLQSAFDGPNDRPH